MQDNVSMKQETEGKKPSGSIAGKVFVWMLLLSLIAGGGWYWWMARKGAVPSIPQATPSAVAPSAQEKTPPSGETLAAMQPSATPDEKGQSAGSEGKQGEEQRRSLDKTTTPSAASGRQDDTVVKVTFIEDLATWMVNGYRPSPSGKGRIRLDVQQANMRYGVHLKGLGWHGESVHSGRRDVLHYVFTPGMLSGLYRLYGDRLLEQVLLAAQGKPLTPEQQGDMLVQYANRFQSLAGILSRVAAVPDLPGRLASIQSARKRVMDTESRYSELVYTLEQARERGAAGSVSELETAMQSAARRYQQAIMERERVTRALVGEIRGNAPERLLDNNTALFVAEWVGRRASSQPSGIQAASQAAQILEDLARRFEGASRQ